jgi:hypothetical protein
VRYAAVLGLLVQLTGIALAPLALCCRIGITGATSTSASADEHECCKAVGPGEVCPLHQPSKESRHDDRGSAPAKSDCAMKSGCKAPDLALLSMLGSGIVSSPTPLVVDLPSSLVHLPSFDPIARDFVPDTPPPRV